MVVDRRSLVGVAVGLAAAGLALLLLAGDPAPSPDPRDSARSVARPPGPRLPERPSEAAETPRGPSTVAASPPVQEPVVLRFTVLEGQLGQARRAAPDDGTRGAVLAVVARAEEDAAALRAAFDAGEVSEGELRARIGKIRLDAATSFDGVTGPDASRALKEALGFDMRGADDLGWGVPLNDANLGQVFDDG